MQRLDFSGSLKAQLKQQNSPFSLTNQTIKRVGKGIKKRLNQFSFD